MIRESDWPNVWKSNALKRSRNEQTLNITLHLILTLALVFLSPGSHGGDSGG